MGELQEEKETSSGSSSLSDPPVPEIMSKEPLFKDELYYLDFVQFEIEDSIVRVPRYHFTNPPRAQQETERLNEETIGLPDVQLEEFHQLLSVLYPLHPNDGPKTADNWISVLYLSTRYQLYQIRQLAITALEKYKLPMIKRILLARQFGLVEWLTEEYLTLVKREESISFEEARDLGLTTTIKLCQIREYGLTSSKPKIAPVRPTPATQPPPPPQAISVPKSTSSPPSFIFVTDPKPAPSTSRLEPLPKPSPASSAPPAAVVHDLYLENIDRIFGHEFASTNVVVTDSIERAVLARSLGIVQWLRDAYLELARRHEGLSEVEAERLGLEASVGIYQVRENVLSGGDMDLARGNGDSEKGGGSCKRERLLEGVEYEKLVKTKFELELGDVRRDGALYSGLARSWAVVVLDEEVESEGGKEA